MENATEVHDAVKSFNKTSLKKTKTEVKVHKPTQEEINAEKEAIKEGK